MSELTVYLQVSTPVQLTRTSRNQKPLLSLTNLKAFLNKLHDQRDSRYDETASLVINSDDSALDSHVANIAKLISQDVTQESKEIYLDDYDVIIFHKTLHIPIQLTKSQDKCLKLLSQGKSSKEIARELDISYSVLQSCSSTLCTWFKSTRSV